MPPWLEHGAYKILGRMLAAEVLGRKVDPSIISSETVPVKLT